MKKLLLFTLLIVFLCSPAYAWMSVPMCGGGVAAASCAGGSTTYVGDTATQASGYSFTADYMQCQLYEANCSGTFGTVSVYHSGTDTDNIKVGVFNSVYQTDLTSQHLPDVNDTQVTSSSWVTLSCNTNGGWCTSGATKLGGSAVSGTKYLLCWITDASAWVSVRSSTAGNYVYQIQSDTWGSYASPPTNLDDGNTAWAAYTPRSWSVYVTIE
jgi:hypothetical protein